MFTHYYFCFHSFLWNLKITGEKCHFGGGRVLAVSGFFLAVRCATTHAHASLTVLLSGTFDGGKRADETETRIRGG